MLRWFIKQPSKALRGVGTESVMVLDDQLFISFCAASVLFMQFTVSLSRFGCCCCVLLRLLEERDNGTIIGRNVGRVGNAFLLLFITGKFLTNSNPRIAFLHTNQVIHVT